MVSALLKNDGSALVVCPGCQRQFKIKAPEFEKIGNGYKVSGKCPCGESFIISFNRRRHPRLGLEVSGAYHHLKHDYRGLITVRNISLSGVGIELNTQRLMLAGDRVTIRFNLNDEDQTFIERKAVIRRKQRKTYFGLEFTAETTPQDPLFSYLAQP
ncbi:hypothetical protein D3OALGA1CA_834 [Olavius algarvensis associated proteobacterium Delta 3]|nr:hypothetical protein D3OALGA1CA_834 [Olavius algarvensis associated proteobacterium Delta 3]CAB5142852.1 hypothetical protein D3OALGB2SA_4337 [Olavius algarvensis associated proteobacterium Delta 3]